MEFKGGIPYGGGTPYAFEVRRLEAAFPAEGLVEGRVITHAELEQIISEKRGSSRYYGTINCWLRALKNERALILYWRRNVGLFVPPPSDLFEFVRDRHGQRRRQVVRVARLMRYVDDTRLKDDEERAAFNHEQLYMARISHILGDTRREIIGRLLPIESLPKRPGPSVQ